MANLFRAIAPRDPAAKLVNVVIELLDQAIAQYAQSKEG